MAVPLRRPYPVYRVNSFKPVTKSPMADINITPLIDVLLVLLVMIILTIPIAAHKVNVDLPRGDSPSTGPAAQFDLTISPSGAIYWDGENVSRAQLRKRFTKAGELSVEPVIRFQPDPQASYDDSVQVIALAGEARLRKFAFIGNEHHASFAKD